MGETRYRVGSEDDVEEGEPPLITEADGLEIAVFLIDGEYHALANYCPHQAGPLCEGEIKGKLSIPEGEWMWQYDEEEPIIACPWHDWRYEIASGRNIDDKRYSVPSYEVEVDGSDLYVTR